MVDAIRPLTIKELRANARAAAEQNIPHDEANHHEPGSQLWLVFREEYHDAVMETA